MNKAAFRAAIAAETGIESVAPNDRPEVYDELFEVWRGFQDLNLRRAIHFGGVGAIPFVEIATYCELFEVRERSRFVRLVCAMDREFLSWSGSRGSEQTREH